MQALIEPLRGTTARMRLSTVPTPEPVPPTPPRPDVVDPDPVNPEPTSPVQEPPDEGDVPTRLPGHPGQPVHMRSRHTMRHEHPGA
jgi:hypothetical protein